MAERITLKGTGKAEGKSVSGFKIRKIFEVPVGSTILFSPDFRPEFTGKKPEYADNYEFLKIKEIIPVDDEEAKIITEDGLLLKYTADMKDKMVYELPEYHEEQPQEGDPYSQDYGGLGGMGGGGGMMGGGGGYFGETPFLPGAYYPPVYTPPVTQPGNTTIVIGGRTLSRPPGTLVGGSHLPPGGGTGGSGGGGLTTGTLQLPSGGLGGGTVTIGGRTLSRPTGGLVGGANIPPSGGGTMAPPIGGTVRNFGVDAENAGYGEDGMLGFDSNFTDDVPGMWEWASGEPKPKIFIKKNPVTPWIFTKDYLKFKKGDVVWGAEGKAGWRGAFVDIKNTDGSQKARVWKNKNVIAPAPKGDLSKASKPIEYQDQKNLGVKRKTKSI